MSPSTGLKRSTSAGILLIWQGSLLNESWPNTKNRRDSFVHPPGDTVRYVKYICVPGVVLSRPSTPAYFVTIAAEERNHRAVIWVINALEALGITRIAEEPLEDWSAVSLGSTSKRNTQLTKGPSYAEVCQRCLNVVELIYQMVSATKLEYIKRLSITY